MIAHEVAKSAGVSADVVRYYSRIGLLNPIRNPDNGYRKYTPQDVIRVNCIKKAKWLGFTLKDVKTILAEADSGKSPCGEVRRIISERISENQQRLKHLHEMQERMQRAMTSVVGSSSSKIEMQHTTHAGDHPGHINHGTDPGNHNCPHCDNSGHDKNYCKSEASKICDNEESYVYGGRIKPADHEKFHGEHQPLKLLCNPDDLTQIGQLVASETGKSPPPFQGPKLTDLYRVYLK